MTDSTCLTGDTAALGCAYYIELTFCGSNAEGLVDDELERFETEVIVNISAVYRDVACACIEANAGNGFLSSACAVEVGFSACIHNLAPP